MSHSPDIRQRLTNSSAKNAQSRSAVKIKSLTLTLEEIPEWQRDNDFILTGYRRCARSVKTFTVLCADYGVFL